MKKRTIILAYYWISTIAWAGLIYFLSEQPNLQVTSTDWDELLRKIAHMFFFAVQTILIYRALLWTVRTKIREFELRKDFDASILIEWLLLVIAILATILYAAFDEYHQTWVPTRSGNITDVLIDSVGILLAAFALFKAGILTEVEHRFARTGWQILTGQKYYGE